MMAPVHAPWATNRVEELSNDFPKEVSHTRLKINSGRYEDICCNFAKLGVLIIVVC